MRKVLVESLLAACSRLLFLPLTLLIPRDACSWVVIGRERGKFVDNAKHFYCWLHEHRGGAVRTTFVGEIESTNRQIRERGAAAVHYPSLAGIWALLRAGTVIVDSAEYIEHGRVGLLTGARIVQIWHGAPLKEIEIPLFERRLSRRSPLNRFFLRLQKQIVGRHALIDVLVSTSAFFSERAFEICFRAERICATGYPRNDAMLSTHIVENSLAMLNTDDEARRRLEGHRARAGRRTVLYAPTFRAGDQSPFENGIIDLEILSDFAVRNDLVFAMKLHPVMSSHFLPGRLPGIVEISANSDVYPLLRHIDVLVTDYSSIYFDYLLLDRPIIFYAYDLEAYVTEDRRLLFDYTDMTPGPKARTFKELLGHLSMTLESEGTEWMGARHRVRGLTFDETDGSASERLCCFLENRKP